MMGEEEIKGPDFGFPKWLVEHPEVPTALIQLNNAMKTVGMAGIESIVLKSPRDGWVLMDIIKEKTMMVGRGGNTSMFQGPGNMPYIGIKFSGIKIMWPTP